MAAREHARLSPSSAYRWMNCPGSVRMSDGIESKSSVYAEEGTAAHMLAERCMRLGHDAAQYADRVIDVNGDNFITQFLVPEADDHDTGRFRVDEEMVDAVQLFLDTVRAAIEPGDEVHIEHRVRFTGDQFGTADVLIRKPKKKWVHVFDLKYGAGLMVEVRDADGRPNEQLACYGEGAVRGDRAMIIRGVTITIVQPRMPHPDGPVRSVELDAVQMVQWMIDLSVAAARTEEPDAPLVAGDWCRWCPAAGGCPAFASRALAVAQTKFDNLDATVNLPSAELMTPEQRARVLDGAGLLEAWVKSVRQHAYAEAEAGRGTPGYKLVDKVPRRKWSDEEEMRRLAVKKLGLKLNALYEEPAIKSPAQIEKMVGKKDFAAVLGDLAPKVSSGTTLAPVNDRRPAVVPAIEHLFEVMEDEH